MNKNILIMIAIAIVFAGGGYYIGMKSTSSALAQNPAARGVNRQPGASGRGFGGGVTGEILSVDNTGVTVKLPDGSSKIVFLSANTSFNKSDPATKDDLKVGTRVAVFGSANSDGSVTAQNVNLNPMMRPTASGSANQQ